MQAVADDMVAYTNDQLALILDFMDRHARVLQRVTGDVRKAVDPAA